VISRASRRRSCISWARRFADRSQFAEVHNSKSLRIKYEAAFWVLFKRARVGVAYEFFVEEWDTEWSFAHMFRILRRTLSLAILSGRISAKVQLIQRELIVGAIVSFPPRPSPSTEPISYSVVLVDGCSVN
jgi:hypothetical protein